MITIPTYIATQLAEQRVQQLHAEAAAARRLNEARAARRRTSAVDTTQVTRLGWLHRRPALGG